MAAGKYSFIIEQGATTNFQINWNDESGSAVDLSGYQARMQIRPGVESSDIFLSLSSSINIPGTYANDTAAATAGVKIGGLYHTTGTVKVRLT